MVINNLGTARGTIQISTDGLKEADISLRSAGRGALFFGAAALAGFGYVVNAAADFEKEMDFVRVITQATTEDMERLQQAAIDLGKQGPFGPREVANSFVELAKAGIDVEDILAGVGEASVQLAAAGDLGLTRASEILVNSLRTFGLGGGDAVRVADLIAGAANASTIEVEDFAFSLKFAGSVADAAGIPIEELATAIAILGDRGIKGSTAGTSLRRILLNLNPASEKAATVMEELGIITEDAGNAFFDAEGNAKSLRDIFEILNDATEDLTQEEKIDKLNDIFGARAVASALILLKQGADGWDDYVEAIDRTTAAEVAEARLDNLAGAITRLKAAIEATFIETGTPFQAFLTDLVNLARDLVLWWGRLPPELQSFILGGIAVIGILSILSGIFLLTIGNIIRTVRVISELGFAFRVIGGLLAGLPGTLARFAAGVGAFLISPLGLVVLAILAIIAAFTYFYLTSEDFRNFINGLGEDIADVWGSVLDFFENDFVDGIGTAVDTVKGYFSDLRDDILAIGGDDPLGAAFDLAKRVPKVGLAVGAGTGLLGIETDEDAGIFERIGNEAGLAARGGLQEFGQQLTPVLDSVGQVSSGALDSVGSFFANIGNAVGGAATGTFDTVTSFFTETPGIVTSAVGGALSDLGSFLSDPGRIGYALGFALGRTIRWAAQIGTVFNGLVGKVAGPIARWGARIIGGVARWTANTLVNVGNWALDMALKAAEMGGAFLIGVGLFFSRLPGVIGRWLISSLFELISRIPAFAQGAWEIGWSIFYSIRDFMADLPGMIYDFLTEGLFEIIGQIPEFFQAAYDLGKSIFDGAIDGIGDLAGAIADIFLGAISSIGDLVTDAWNAARDFGAGLWGGFKDGLGIESPSYIERALFAIEDQAAATQANLLGSLRSINAQTANLPSASSLALMTDSTLPLATSGVSNQTSGNYIYNQNAPLIGQATIRSDEDIVELARALDKEQRRGDRARGVDSAFN